MGEAAGTLRASQLGSVTIEWFSIQPETLGGLLTWSEQNYLSASAGRPAFAGRYFPSDHELARQFERVATTPATAEFRKRFQLVDLWAAAFEDEFAHAAPVPSDYEDAKGRFRRLIDQIPEAELQEYSIDDLARQLRCSPRHLSRLFRETFGVSLRTKQTELRLLKACRLLTDSNEKVINVAMDSGYRHLGLFNAMFKKRFGMTPTEWRRSNESKRRVRSGARLAARMGGIVSLTVGLLFGGGCLRSTAAEGDAPQTNDTHQATATSTNGPVFEVQRYEIIGNSILNYPAMERILTNAVGPQVSLDQIRKALAELQLAYRQRGYATVVVSLPQQQVTNATIRVQVTEGVLTDIRVTDNRYYSSNNVMRSLPSLKTNTLLNSQVLQRELDAANANRDRQIYPTVGPGPEPGTSSLTLKVKDRLPVHGSFELDNYNTIDSPSLRMNLAGQYNNLWQLDHQVGLSYGFTPQALKQTDAVPNYFFNQPLISYYGTYYRLPLSSPESIQTAIDNRSQGFGYDEATREFRMPPATGRSDLIFYASGSSSDTGVQYTEMRYITNTAITTVFAQDSGQDITINDAVGFRFTQPVPALSNFRFSISAGLDYKYWHLQSFNTNFFIAISVIPNPDPSQPPDIIRTVTPSPAPTRENSVNYLPATLQLDFSESDKFGNTSFSLVNSINYMGNSGNFARASYTPDATPFYGKINLSLSREQKIGGDWTALLRANAQLATGPLINNEQFALGGMGSVRGYYEGEEYGDDGWFVSIEPRTPQFNLGVVDGTLPMWVRASVFMDYGRRYLIADTPLPRMRALWGTGVAVSANIGNHYDLRLAVAWPLLDGNATQAGDVRILFSVGAQF
jgi:hemolysin activation/secretion protein/AraC-like DNA-binding protein